MSNSVVLALITSINNYLGGTFAPAGATGKSQIKNKKSLKKGERSEPSPAPFKMDFKHDFLTIENL